MAKQKVQKQETNVETSKNVVKKEKAMPPVQSGDIASWGKAQLFQSSIVIPRVLLQQFMSPRVKEQKAKYGDFVDSLTGEKLGSMEKPFEIIPFHKTEKWIVYDLVKGGKKEFSEVIEVTSENEGWRYEREKDGKTQSLDRAIDVYFLDPKDLDGLPKILGFRRTSLRSGKQLLTQMYIQNASKQVPPPGVVMNISTKSVEGEEGTYAVIEVAPGRKSTQGEVSKAFEWYKKVTSGEVKAAEDTEIMQPRETSELNVEEVTDY